MPEKIDGFELQDADRVKMTEVWPEGEDVALQVSPLNTPIMILDVQLTFPSDSQGIFDHESALISTGCRLSSCIWCSGVSKTLSSRKV